MAEADQFYSLTVGATFDKETHGNGQAIQYFSRAEKKVKKDHVAAPHIHAGADHQLHHAGNKSVLKPASNALSFFGTEAKDEAAPAPAASETADDDKKSNPVKKMTGVKRQRILKKLELEVKGKDVPQPMEHFSELVRPPNNVDRSIVTNLFDRNHRIPTPIQSQAIPCLLQGRDVLACAPTGSGKTVAFLVPLFAQLKAPRPDTGVRAVIVSPTKELAMQIEREAFFLMKGKQRWRLVQHGQSTSGKDIFVTTPKRIVDLVKSKSIDLSAVEYVVFDEGDRLWDDNSDFLSLMDSVLAATTKKEKTLCLFSATLSAKVEQMARTVMHDPVRIIVKGRQNSSSNVDQSLLYTGNELGKIEAVRNMVRFGLTPPVLIFVQSVERTKELYDEIKTAGLHVALINAKMTSEERDETVMQFRLGNIWVLITTELLARGMDFKGVGTVINFDFPTSAESYIHRVGRTGRAGRRGKAVTFYTDDDKERLPVVAKIVEESGGHVEEWMKALKMPSRKRQRELQAKTPQRMIVSTKKRMMVGKLRTNRQRKAMERSGEGPGADDSDDDFDDDDDEE